MQRQDWQEGDDLMDFCNPVHPKILSD